jgi:HSP20 family protein
MRSLPFADLWSIDGRQGLRRGAHDKVRFERRTCIESRSGSVPGGTSLHGAFAAVGKHVMAAVDPRTLMWTAACEMIDRAERLHRRFFLPIAAPMGDLGWEPPVDITATDSEILITVALPGVDRDAVKVTVDDDGISVLGFRPGRIPRGSLVHRLEIPYGKFQRRIAFPGARRRLGQSDLANGCLMLKFSN